MKSYCKYLFIGVLFLASCSGDDTQSSIEDFLFLRNIMDAQETSSGITYSIERNGDGLIGPNDYILFHLRQLDAGNNIIGETFNTNFPIAQAIPGTFSGFNEAIQLIGEGGRMTMIVPADLTDGLITEGIIIYEVSIIGVFESLEDYNDKLIEDYLSVNAIEATRLDNGIYLVVEEPGEDERPEATAEVSVKYRGFFLNGEEFDRAQTNPLIIRLDGVIEGWQQGIPQFGRGGKGLLFIPSNLAYAEQGQGSIPPNYPIAFEIELVDFN